MARHSTHVTFRFEPEAEAGSARNLKVEINTREHQNLFELQSHSFALESGWYRSKAQIVSYVSDELFGTKLRALLQRNKGRDLFDFGIAMAQLKLQPARVVKAFAHYVELEGLTISRAQAEKRMLEKLQHSLTEDIQPLLPRGVQYAESDALLAFQDIWNSLIARLDGNPFRMSESAQAEIKERFPTLRLG